ncbi:MaoC/PaaZ C-terminal domain-containing protein [Pseudonocardia kunmingensis]|uniref:Acyl dehydratase n=1 Tax=Pseudonocardia kunmingensis TaxID=630975 RepID=A0A543CXK4_9PSEU|nr:MaoC/PaaZ C-terminal domain-containing protein [Pseudonocardia kunmingensis]TQM01847.1 acyl dehydratase [Pseudonocardia kunmingensis]
MSGDEVLPEWALAEVDPEKMKVLALLLADPNPLHFDPAVAPRLGVAERPVNQGPSNMAMLVNLLRAAYPRGRLRRLTVQLRGSVVAGQSVRASGRVTGRERQGATETVRCEVALGVDGGRVVLSGEAEVEIPVVASA